MFATLPVLMGNHLGSCSLCGCLTLGSACGSEEDRLIMPLITANVLLSPSSAMRAGGGAVELRKTQITIHQLMGSSSAAWCERRRECVAVRK